MWSIQDFSRSNAKRKCSLKDGQLMVDFRVRGSVLLTIQDKPLHIGSRDNRCPATTEKWIDVLAYSTLNVAKRFLLIDSVVCDYISNKLVDLDLPNLGADRNATGCVPLPRLKQAFGRS
jgi:hypothetical protein